MPPSFGECISVKMLLLCVVLFTSDVLGSCCQSDEIKSFKMLSTESPVWRANCFQTAIDAESLLFFNHDGLEVGRSDWLGQLFTSYVIVLSYVIYSTERSGQATGKTFLKKTTTTEYTMKLPHGSLYSLNTNKGSNMD